MSELKKAAALAAVELVETGTVVGLGSGSTLAYFIRALGDRIRRGQLRVVGVPTSHHSRLLARECSIPLADPMDVDGVDLAVDGADEIDPAGNLIKGAGGAHVMEKVIAACARRFVVAVDESKCVPVLGDHAAVPVEVIAPALAFAVRRLRELGGTPVVRCGSGKLGPVISDLGHPLIDVTFGRIADAAWLDRQLNAIPGVVGHGLFVGMTDRAIIARPPPDQPRIDISHFPRLS